MTSEKICKLLFVFFEARILMRYISYVSISKSISKVLEIYVNEIFHCIINNQLIVFSVH